MYHSLSDCPLGLHPYYETTTSPPMFRQQLAQLHELGFRAVSVSEGMRLIEDGKDFEPCVAVSFDDGYRDVYTEALPALREYGFTATVYVIAGKCKPDRTQFKDRDCLTTDEISELHMNGIEIGSHTISHPQLHDLAWNEVEREVSESKKLIEDALGLSVVSFCYPFAFPETDGKFVMRFRSLLRESGYSNAVTTVIGTVDSRSDRFSLPRLPVNNFDDKRLFQAKLEGGYDWLHIPQYLIKSLKRFAHAN